MNKERFGTFIAENRKEMGLTQAQLAEKLHVTDKAVSKWERGLSYPDVTLLEPLAGIFGISIDALLRCQSLEDDGEERKMEEQNESIQTVVEISRENQKGERRQWLKAVIVMAVTLALIVAVFVIDNQVANRKNPYRDHEWYLTGVEYTEHTPDGDYVYINQDYNTPILQKMKCGDGIDIDSIKAGWKQVNGVLCRAQYFLDYDMAEGLLVECELQSQYETIAILSDLAAEGFIETEKPLFGQERTYWGVMDNSGSTFFCAPPTPENPEQWRVLLTLPNWSHESLYEITDVDGDGINELICQPYREEKVWVLYDVDEDDQLVTTWYDVAPEWADLLPEE